jgi:7-cyano-7-deazaguanine synthase in queuosine biosynthesis
MMPIKIIMLSGGFDSTGLLFWALGRPEWHVIAHHINLVNYERRADLEAVAVGKILSYLRRHDFEYDYTSSRIENMDPVFYEKDIVNVGFIAAVIAQSTFKRYRRANGSSPDIEVFTGGTLEDHVDEQISTGAGIAKKNRVFDAMLCDFDYPVAVRPRISIPFKNSPKRELVKYIPAKLLPHLWTCRTPTRRGGQFVECGSCVSCERKKLIAEIM